MSLSSGQYANLIKVGLLKIDITLAFRSKPGPPDKSDDIHVLHFVIDPLGPVGHAA